MHLFNHILLFNRKSFQTVAYGNFNLIDTNLFIESSIKIRTIFYFKLKLTFAARAKVYYTNWNWYVLCKVTTTIIKYLTKKPQNYNWTSSRFELWQLIELNFYILDLLYAVQTKKKNIFRKLSGTKMILKLKITFMRNKISINFMTTDCISW